MATEGDEVKLRCNISSDASALYYKVLWFYASPASLSMNYSLVELDHTGLLTYPMSQALSGLQSRLRLSRPTQNDFYLGIQRAHKADSGIYWCQVEQYQLDNDGQWKQKASKTSGSITLTVNVTGRVAYCASVFRNLARCDARGGNIPCCAHLAVFKKKLNQCSLF